MRSSLLALLAIALLHSRGCVALDNGLGLSGPPMGWSSWNHFGPHVNASIIERAATAMAENGMKAL